MTTDQRTKITYKSLQANRKFLYVAILFIAACLTESPDYPGQLLLSIPSIILFEILIYLMSKYKNNFKYEKLFMTTDQRTKITYKSLQANRKFLYVAILFIAACLTESPDYPGQLLLSIPSIILFEILIYLMSKYKIVLFTNWQEQ